MHCIYSNFFTISNLNALKYNTINNMHKNILNVFEIYIIKFEFYYLQITIDKIPFKNIGFRHFTELMGHTVYRYNVHNL